MKKYKQVLCAFLVLAVGCLAGFLVSFRVQEGYFHYGHYRTVPKEPSSPDSLYVQEIQTALTSLDIEVIRREIGPARTPLFDLNLELYNQTSTQYRYEVRLAFPDSLIPYTQAVSETFGPNYSTKNPERGEIPHPESSLMFFEIHKTQRFDPIEDKLSGGGQYVGSLSCPMAANDKRASTGSVTISVTAYSPYSNLEKAVIQHQIQLDTT